MTEVDTFAGFPTEVGDDRVFALRDIAGDSVPTWKSEFEFLHDDEKRLKSDRADISHRFYDDDPDEPWTVVYVVRTQEIYAFRRARVGPADAPRPEMWEGMMCGPCVLLGHLPTWEVADKALDSAGITVGDRLGGLAWAYGRIRLTHRLMDAFTAQRGFELASAWWKYLESLPGDERPR